MDIIIDRIQNTSITYKQVIDLMHESFEERLEQGLHFTCSSMTEEQYRKKTEKSEIIVAIDKESGCLVGTATVHIFNEHRFAYLEYLAISVLCKGKGLASMIFQQEIVPMSEKAGCDYIVSDTAAKADSSVRWHKKQGFKIVGFASSKYTNYYSYVFRKQLKHPSKWDCQLYVSVRFILKKIRVRLCRTAEGPYTAFGRFMAKLSGKII